MDGGKSEAALSRIEAAMARIEAVVRHRDVAGGDGPEWQARHQRLREAVSRSLEQLDQLIERQAETLNE
jgi:L-lactate utilization protein LutB